MTKLVNMKVPMNVIYKNDKFILLSITVVYKYVDGQRTNIIEGYKYNVVDTTNYDKIGVKVAQEKPLLTSEELEELKSNGEKVFVEFVNGVDKLYIHRDGNTVSLEDSFSAEDVVLAEQD